CCDRDLHSFRCDFRLGGRAPVKISQWCKTRCLPTDDCVGNWQTEQAGANRRMRISPGSEPDWQRTAIWTRYNKRVVQRRTKFTLPSDVLAFIDLQKQIEFLSIKRIIVVE